MAESGPPSGGPADVPDPSGGGVGRVLRRLIRPLRRAVRWLALVGEEQSVRHQEIERLEQRHGHLLAQLSQAEAEFRTAFWKINETLDRGITDRAEAILQELWRRMESADAHHATAIQMLVAEVERISRDNAKLISSLPADPEDVRAVAALSGRSSQQDELTGRTDVRAALDRARATLAIFQAPGPLLVLGCGDGVLLEVAGLSGIESYGIDESAAVVTALRRIGLNVAAGDALEHLASLRDGTLGGVFVDAMSMPGILASMADLLREASRVVRPGAPVAIDVRGEGTAHGASTNAGVTGLARAAGLVIERSVDQTLDGEPRIVIGRRPDS